MAAYPKEDTEEDPLDDEWAFKNTFQKAGSVRSNACACSYNHQLPWRLP